MCVCGLWFVLSDGLLGLFVVWVAGFGGCMRCIMVMISSMIMVMLWVVSMSVVNGYLDIMLLYYYG